MSTVQEIESAITQLKPKDIQAVAEWLLEYREMIWDKEIAADARFGSWTVSSKKPKPAIVRGRQRLFREIQRVAGCSRPQKRIAPVPKILTLLAINGIAH